MNQSRIQIEEQYGRILWDNLNWYFLSWYLPLVLLVGTVGGLFCTLFIFMSKMFPKIIQVWLVSICFGDLMILVWDAGRMFGKQAFDYDFRDQGLAICKMQVYFSSFFFHWSAYNQAAMSVQRLVFIASPLRARTLLNTRRVFCFWGCMTVLLVFPNITYLLKWHIGNRDDCEPVDKWFYYVTTLVHLIVWGIIPVLAMFVCTGCISYRLITYKRSQFRKQPTERRDSRAPRPALIGGRRHGSDQGAHVTRLLVCMNLFYLFTTFPLLIYMMHLNFRLDNNVGYTIARSLHKFYYYLFRSLCFLNASLNWVFYCAAGKIFRQKSKQILYRLFCGRGSRFRNVGTGAGAGATGIGIGGPASYQPRGSSASYHQHHHLRVASGSSELLSAMSTASKRASGTLTLQVSMHQVGGIQAQRSLDCELQETIQRLQQEQEDRL